MTEISYDSKMGKRYTKKTFPHYVFVPGMNPHPKKSGGHMEGEGDPIAEPLDPDDPSQSEFLKYSLDLYNHGYFWESHVYFEALWNAHGRTGDIADFLKGMIKLGAAGVKVKIDQLGSAKGHLERARELFQKVMEHQGSKFLGFDLKNLIAQIDSGLLEGVFYFEVHPDWE